MAWAVQGARLEEKPMNHTRREGATFRGVLDIGQTFLSTSTGNLGQKKSRETGIFSRTLESVQMMW